jgi:hypothetical protein
MRDYLFCPSHDTLARWILLNILQGAENSPKLAEEVAVVSVIQIAEKRLDGLCRFICLVEGDTARRSLG